MADADMNIDSIEGKITLEKFRTLLEKNPLKIPIIPKNPKKSWKNLKKSLKIPNPVRPAKESLKDPSDNIIMMAMYL